MNLLTTVTALSLVLGVSIREEVPRNPHGPLPVHGVAVMDHAGRVTVKQEMEKVILMARRPRLNKKTVLYTAGANVYHKEILICDPRSIVIRKTVRGTRTMAYDPGEVRAYDTRGIRIDPGALRRLLKTPIPVMVSADGMRVHPSRLRGVKKGTLVLVLPRR